MLDTGILSGKKKVVIVGAGFVGSTIAYALMLKNLAGEIVLVDYDQKKAAAEALDMQHGIPFAGSPSVRAGGYEDCEDASLIIITAGRNRRPGESRLDLIADNLSIMRSIVDQIRPHFRSSVILIVANPVDILTYFCDKWMGFTNGRIFGSGCILDTSRLIYKIAEYVGLNIEMVKCDVVGEHGESQFPLWSGLTIGGVPIEEYCAATGLQWGEKVKTAIYQQVKDMGATIIEGKGKTHYGIASCVCLIADAILNQRQTIIPVSSVLHGEYGVCDVALSVPSVIGMNGVERISVCEWREDEYEALRVSGEKLKKIIHTL